jgi:hypothetical protein
MVEHSLSQQEKACPEVLRVYRRGNQASKKNEYIENKN